MPREALVAAIECTALSGHPSPEVVFFGGEPLLEGLLLRKAVALLRARTRPGWRAQAAPRDERDSPRRRDHPVRSRRGDCRRSLLRRDPRVTGTEGARHVRRPRPTASKAERRRLRGDRGPSSHPDDVDRCERAPPLRLLLLPPVAGRDGNRRRTGPRSDASLGASAARELDRQLSRVVRLCAADRRPSSAAIFAPLPAGRSNLGARSRTDLRCRAPWEGVRRRRRLARALLGPGPILGAETRSRSFSRRSRSLAGAERDRPGPWRRSARNGSGRLHGLPFFVDLAKKRSVRGPCASCEALSECFVCPASIAFAPEQDPGLVPAIQCDWNRLVARHRRAFLARARLARGRTLSAPAAAPARPRRAPSRRRGSTGRSREQNSAEWSGGSAFPAAFASARAAGGATPSQNIDAGTPSRP